jgi:radical SAM superfamily enzyme YgiQ (UPF0313 family)
MTSHLRILLVQPAWAGLGYRRKIKVNERALHPLSLGVVAALSGGHEVRILDEARETVPPSARDFAVVGLSVNTFNAYRAYQLADRFRAEGVPVVLGGPHAALMPDECLQHADSVVIGDAEDTWPRLLEDLAGGCLKPRYLSGGQVGALMPAPRRDLFHRSSPHVAWCQMSRGCGNQCRFCYLQYLPQHGLRVRPVDSVVAELRALPQRVILFVDDNVFCQPEYTRDVLQAITPLGKKWWIQAPANLHQQPGLIELMARSGCFSVSIGFQTASNANNQAEQILQNRVEDYGALVQQLRQAGILVDGTFIFGFDGDHPGTFEATEALIRRLRLDTYTFYFLTPYPGTPYFSQFENEGRLLHRDWARYDWDHVVVRPKQMSVEQLREGVKNLYQRLDRGYFLQNGLRQAALHRRTCASISLLRFLMSTGWNYYRSPIFPAGAA